MDYGLAKELTTLSRQHPGWSSPMYTLNLPSYTYLSWLSHRRSHFANSIQEILPFLVFNIYRGLQPKQNNINKKVKMNFCGWKKKLSWEYNPVRLWMHRMWRSNYVCENRQPFYSMGAKPLSVLKQVLSKRNTHKAKFRKLSFLQLNLHLLVTLQKWSKSGSVALKQTDLSPRNSGGGTATAQYATSCVGVLMHFVDHHRHS